MNPAWLVVGGVAVVWLIYSNILPGLVDLLAQASGTPMPGPGNPASSTGGPPATLPPVQQNIAGPIPLV